MLLLLLSVFFQSYIAQTHIHRAGPPFTQIMAETAASGAPQGPLSPADGDHADCLLCQAVFQAGAFAVPVVMAILLPAMLFLGLAEASPSRPALAVQASHGWRSRAPPRS